MLFQTGKSVTYGQLWAVRLLADETGPQNSSAYVLLGQGASQFPVCHTGLTESSAGESNSTKGMAVNAKVDRPERLSLTGGQNSFGLDTRFVDVAEYVVCICGSVWGGLTPQ